MTQTKTYIEVSKEWRGLSEYLFVIDHCGQRGLITCEYQSCDAYGGTVNCAEADYFVAGFRPYNGGELGKQTKIFVLPTDVVTLKVDKRAGA